MVQIELWETHSPVSVNANKALYIRQTMMPISSFQCSMSHIFAKVPLMYHVSRLQPSAHSTVRKEFSAMFNRGLRPEKHCRKMVNVSTATDARDAAISYTSMSVHISLLGKAPSEHEQR